MIDLLGRGGITVNESKQSVALLKEGDELGIGQYRMRAVYETPPAPLETAPEPPPETSEFSVSTASAAAVENVAEELVAALPDPKFLTRNNRIFPVSFEEDTVIVRPQGGIRTASYQQMQLESNTITQLLMTRPNLQNVIVDVGNTDAMDSIIISCVSAICRAAKGRAALCNCSPAMLSVLTDMNLTNVWPHLQTREEAVAYVRSEST